MYLANKRYNQWIWLGFVSSFRCVLRNRFKKWNLKLGTEMKESKVAKHLVSWLKRDQFSVFKSDETSSSELHSLWLVFQKQNLDLMSVEKSRNYVYKQYPQLQLKLCHTLPNTFCVWLILLWCHKQMTFWIKDPVSRHLSVWSLTQKNFREKIEFNQLSLLIQCSI